MPDPTWDQRGIYDKWLTVHRRSPGRHVNCEVFVLDPAHDPYAGIALHAYADAVEPDNAQLAADLHDLADRNNIGAPARIYADTRGLFDNVEPNMHYDPKLACFCACGSPGAHH